jgi:hypothetical protein
VCKGDENIREKLSTNTQRLSSFTLVNQKGSIFKENWSNLYKMELEIGKIWNSKHEIMGKNVL